MHPHPHPHQLRNTSSYHHIRNPHPKHTILSMTSTSHITSAGAPTSSSTPATSPPPPSQSTSSAVSSSSWKPPSAPNPSLPSNSQPQSNYPLWGGQPPQQQQSTVPGDRAHATGGFLGGAPWGGRGRPQLSGESLQGSSVGVGGGSSGDRAGSNWDSVWG